MGQSDGKIDERKPRLVACINAPDPQDGKSGKLMERLEDENTKLRACVIELMLQIQALRGR